MASTEKTHASYLAEVTEVASHHDPGTDIRMLADALAFTLHGLESANPNDLAIREMISKLDSRLKAIERTIATNVPTKI